MDSARRLSTRPLFVSNMKLAQLSKSENKVTQAKNTPRLAPSVCKEIKDSEITIIRKMETGSAGEIMLADYQHLDVVVKNNFNPKISTDLERKFMTLCASPYVVPLYAFAMPSQSLVMQYMKLGSLSHYLSDNRLSLSQLLVIMLDVALGLHDIHSKQVIHRDITPNNIFCYEHQGQVRAKIGDFGISIHCNKEESVDEVKNAGLGLFSDIRFHLDNYRSCSSDIYSFGMVLLSLLFDDKSFHKYVMKDATNFALFYLHSTKQLQSRIATAINLAVKQNSKFLCIIKLIKKCLLTNEKERPSAKEIANELNLLIKKNEIINMHPSSILSEYLQKKETPDEKPLVSDCPTKRILLKN